MTPTSRRDEREAWPDVAKGVCILLVVLWHVVTKHYQQIDWQVTVAGLSISGAWGTLGELLLPLRMPLFFTVSGMFAAAAVGRPLPVLMRTRIAKFAYLYLLWLLIHTLVMSQTPHIDTARARSTWELVEQLTISPTNLWYLYALALYFAIARLTRPLPPTVVLAAALILSATAASGLLPDAGNRGQVLQNVFFFLAGLHLRPQVERLAAQASTRRLLAAALVYAAAVLTMTALRAEAWWGVWPAVSAAAVVLGVTAAAMTARGTPRTAARLSAIGRRTLPIYVMHLPLLACFDELVRGRGVEPTGAWFAVVEPVLLTAALVATCLVLERVVILARAGFLLDLPAPWRSAARARSS